MIATTDHLSRMGGLVGASGEPPRYQLVSRIATGGMAEVFLAIMPGEWGSAKPVVIKRLWPEMARDPECVQLFHNEVRLTLRLNHPNVIHAYESGIDGERHFLAMEYLDGQSLKHILDRFSVASNQGAISLPLGLKIISDLLAGLDYVHGLADLDGSPLRIVHRDVSPQNVFVTCDGTVKLIDFGIAQTATTVEARRPREVKGRVAYMAPEQVAGGPSDHRADLFSVGVMLWELAVGRRLWQGQGDAEIRGRLLCGEPIPFLPKSQGFPPGLAAICSRALAIDPRDRYASALEFQADLASIITGSMPVQARLLGEMITRVFANSRALSRSMIQQSLPAARTSRTMAKEDDRRSTSERELPAITGQSSAEEEVAVRPSSHSSSYSIAAAHVDITQVSPVPKVRLRPRFFTSGWLIGAAAIAAVVACFAFASRTMHPSSRVDTSLTATHRPVPPPPVAPPPVAPIPAPAAATILPSPTVEAPSATAPSDPAKTSKPAARKPTVARAASDYEPNKLASAPASARQEFFELPKATAKQPRVVRAIDREDPYEQ